MPLPQILIIFYRTSVIEPDGTRFALGSSEPATMSGARNENLSADDADRYYFDRHPLHFSSRTPIEAVPAVAKSAQSLSCRGASGFRPRQHPLPGHKRLKPFIRQC